MSEKYVGYAVEDWITKRLHKAADGAFDMALPDEQIYKVTVEAIAPEPAVVEAVAVNMGEWQAMLSAHMQKYTNSAFDAGVEIGRIIERIEGETP